MGSPITSLPTGSVIPLSGAPIPIEGLLRHLHAALYTCDAQGRVTYFNEAAVALWGRTPELGKDLWCGSWRIYRPDGSPMPLDTCPMAMALKEGRSIRGIEIVVERPNGERRRVLPHADPIRDHAGALIGAVNMLIDITDTTAGEEAQQLLAAIVQSSDDAIISKDLTGRITSWNDGAERIFGYTAAEAIGHPVTMLIPPERLSEETEILSRLRQGLRIDHFDTIRRTKDGRDLNISLTVSPVRDRSGKVIGASKVARDITDRVRAEAALREARAAMEQQKTVLEEAVRRRTEELNESHQQLRLSERLASLGTLSAGLGHDMGNLLLPVRIHLETLEAGPLPESLKGEVAAIRVALDYLQQLSNGLRYMAIDPNRAGPVEPVELRDWWQAVHTLLKSALPRGVVLHAEFPPACWVRMSKSALTQAVFNLVQNAGDAMKAAGSGNVRVVARPVGRQVLLIVSDDGPGMTPQVRERCMDPFFTTKSRGVSTGLGLVLVGGLVRDAGGGVEIETAVGKGTTFTLLLPRGDLPLHDSGADRPARAIVQLTDPRLSSFVRSQLEALAYNVVPRAEMSAGVELAVVDDLPAGAWKAQHTIVFQDLNGSAPPPNHALLGKNPPLRAIRDALVAAALAVRGSGGSE